MNKTLHASIRAAGGGVIPDALTRQLGIEPSHGWPKGEPYVFFLGCVSVALREDSWLFRSMCRHHQIYDGPWLELDFHELRRKILSGEVDRTMDPMKYRRPFEGGW